MGLKTEALAFSLELDCAAVGEAGMEGPLLGPEAAWMEGTPLAGLAVVPPLVPVAPAGFLILFLSNGGMA